MSEQSPQAITLPVMAIRGMVMFPGVTTTMRVGRPRSLEALRRAADDDGRIVLVAQREAAVETVSQEDLYDVGVVCMVTAAGEWQGGATVALASGMERCLIRRVIRMDPLIEAEVEVIEQTDTDVPTQVRVRFESLVAALRGTDSTVSLLEALSPEEVDGAIAFNLALSVDDKQTLLAEHRMTTRYEMLIPMLVVEGQIKRAREEVRKESVVTDGERRQYLVDRKRDVEKELRELSGEESGADDLRARIDNADLPSEAREEAERELSRLARMEAGSPEYGVATDYLEWLADLPWHARSEAHVDLDKARAVLDRDHYDRDEVKERILEYLAVQVLRPEARGMVLCFVGAPGVGKTSMGRSIAEATNREFYRVSLGGVRDEAEIVGHRRTYVGALPGALMRALKSVGVNNPVVLLDEVDKLVNGSHGDPASALLEVLDPEQNSSFVDNYIAVPFDLSNIMFICTANTDATIPPMLKDRMEIIRLPGYTSREKLEIARRYLVRKQILATGLGHEQVDFDDAAIELLIEHYTREAGVRNLERRIAGLLRKLARDVVQARFDMRCVTAQLVPELLGPPPYDLPAAERTERPGVCQTLALSDVGGVLMRVEVQRLSGQGGLLVTGSAGDALRESVSLASSYWRSRAAQLGDVVGEFDNSYFHVHFPSGAVPKEGTSSGLALALAFASCLRGLPIPDETAVLGEITLHGRVLPVTGIAERLSTAGRAGIRHVVVPERNRGEIEHAGERKPPEGVRLTYVETIADALETVLPELARQETVGRM